MTTRSHDAWCLMIAERFLLDHPTLNTKENTAELAAEIHACIEGWIEWAEECAK
jgi:hypothetical protein